MSRLRRLILVPTVGLALVAGCDTARPGLGVTNSPSPGSGGEKPAMRTDLPTPGTLGSDEVTGAVAGSDIDAGTGGRGRGATDPATPPGVQPTTPRESAAVVPATPPTIESPTPDGAQGETKPSGNINTGTPRSPQ